MLYIFCHQLIGNKKTILFKHKLFYSRNVIFINLKSLVKHEIWEKYIKTRNYAKIIHCSMNLKKSRRLINAFSRIHWILSRVPWRYYYAQLFTFTQKKGNIRQYTTVAVLKKIKSPRLIRYKILQENLFVMFILMFIHV